MVFAVIKVKIDCLSRERRVRPRIRAMLSSPIVRTTSRDRPKSAPNPRLKSSKKTSKCHVFSFTVLENRKILDKNFRKNYILKKWKKMDRVARRGSLARAPGALKSHNAKKLKGGTLWVFSTSILSLNI